MKISFVIFVGVGILFLLSQGAEISQLQNRTSSTEKCQTERGYWFVSGKPYLKLTVSRERMVSQQEK